MNKLFDSADQYLKHSSWKDLALVKFCLFAVGLLAGMEIPHKSRKSVRIAASVVFVLTYIPLMTKYLGILIGKDEGT